MTTSENSQRIEIVSAEGSGPGAQPYFGKMGSPTPRMDIHAATRDMLSVKATNIAASAFGKQNIIDEVRENMETSRLNRKTSLAIKSLLADELVKTYTVKLQMLAEGIRGHAVMEHNNVDNKLQLVVTEAFGEHLLNLNEKLADTTFRAAMARQKNAERNQQARNAGVMSQRSYDLAEDVSERSFERAVQMLQDVIDAFGENLRARVLQIVSSAMEAK